MARFRRRIDLSKPMISSKISVAKTGVTIDSIFKLTPIVALAYKSQYQVIVPIKNNAKVSDKVKHENQPIFTEITLIAAVPVLWCSGVTGRGTAEAKAECLAGR